MDITESIALFDRGMKCELWGAKTSEMTREGLIIFIGYLDELVSEERLLVGDVPGALSFFRDAKLLGGRRHHEHRLTCMRTEGTRVDGVATPEQVDEMMDVSRRALDAFDGVVSASKYACVGLACVTFPKEAID